MACGEGSLLASTDACGVQWIKIMKRQATDWEQNLCKILLLKDWHPYIQKPFKTNNKKTTNLNGQNIWTNHQRLYTVVIKVYEGCSTFLSLGNVT